MIDGHDHARYRKGVEPSSPLTSPPKEKVRPWFVGYGVAVAVTCLSLLFRLALSNVLTKSSALLLFYPAVLVSALVGGFGAGLLSIAIAVFIGVFFYMLPAHTLYGIGSPGGVGLIVFIGVGLTFSILVESTKRARARADLLLVATQRVAEERTVAYDAERRARTDLEGAMRRLDILQKVTSALSEAASERQIADVLVRNMLAIGRAQLGVVYKYSARSKRLDVVAHGTTGAQTGAEDVDASASTCVASDVAIHGEALWIEDEKTLKERFPRAPSVICGMPYRAVVALPLGKSGGGDEIHGVLLMAYEEPRAYSNDYRTLVTVLSRQATQALDRARLYEAEHRGRERASRLAEVAEVVNAQLDREGTLRALGAWLVPRVGDWCAILVPGETTPMVFTTPTDGDDAKLAEAAKAEDPNAAGGESAPPSQLPPNADAALKRVLDGGPAELYPHPAATLPAPAAFASSVVVPLMSRGRTLAALAVGSTHEGHLFDADDLHMIEQIASRAAVASENAALFQETRAAVRYRDEFLSIASHELNTPLTPLRLQLESALRATGEPARLRDKLLLSVKQVDRISKLVGELLDVSRITNGKLHLRLESVDLADLVREVVESFRSEMARVGCDLHLDIEDSIVASWDRLRLSQVIANLLSNAAKYGAGHPVDITLKANDAKASLTISDRGIGVPTTDHSRIFERFERAASARNYGGFGLGLFIAKQIVEASGGEIHAEGRTGGGTSFHVTLPREVAPS